MTTTMMPIKDIIIRPRFRKDLGDIKALADSIKDIGCLLQPVGINDDNELVYGARRIGAYKFLGWNEIPYIRIPIKNTIKGEFYENSTRKDFTFSERVAILEEIEKQRIGHKAAKGGKLSPFQFEQKDKKSRDIAAQFLKLSPTQLQHEKKIMQKIRQQPERYQGLQYKLDKSRMKVSAAYNQILRDEKRDSMLMEARNTKPISVDMDERGNFVKTYKHGVCIEPDEQKYKIQYACYQLNHLAIQLKTLNRQYQKKIKELQELEERHKLCVICRPSYLKW